MAQPTQRRYVGSSRRAPEERGRSGAPRLSSAYNSPPLAPRPERKRLPGAEGPPEGKQGGRCYCQGGLLRVSLALADLAKQGGRIMMNSASKRNRPSLHGGRVGPEARRSMMIASGRRWSVSARRLCRGVTNRIFTLVAVSDWTIVLGGRL